MPCALCNSAQDLTDEDVIPKWMLRTLDVRDDSITVSVREESSTRQQIKAMRRLKITLNDGLCARCNNELLSRLEIAVNPTLETMIVADGATKLNLASQRMLAVWAIKTVYLLELASRQQYPGSRSVEGHAPSQVELAWLHSSLEDPSSVRLIEPPPRSMVWLAAYDCKASAPGHDSVVIYAPSRAPLPTPDGGEVVGQFTTLAIGFVAFQVFSVNFLEAETRAAPVWNSNPPGTIASAIPLLWPQRVGADQITWPPAAFPYGSFDRLASWDGVLRA